MSNELTDLINTAIAHEDQFNNEPLVIFSTRRGSLHLVAIEDGGNNNEVYKEFYRDRGFKATPIIVQEIPKKTVNTWAMPAADVANWKQRLEENLLKKADANGRSNGSTNGSDGGIGGTGGKQHVHAEVRHGREGKPAKAGAA